MLELGQLAGYTGLALIAGFAAVAGWKLLSGGISLDGLLTSYDRRGRGRSSPGRQQLLLLTLVAAGQYLAAVLHNPGATSLPPVPQSLLGILAGSQALYLGGKAFSLKRPK